MPPLLPRTVFFVAVLLCAVLFSFPQVTLAATSTPNTGIIGTLKIFGKNIGLSDTDPRIIAAKLIRVTMGFIGIVMLVMILSSGAAFMTSAGDEEKIKGAKRTLYNAVIGLIIILSAYSIVTYVVEAFDVAMK